MLRVIIIRCLVSILVLAGISQVNQNYRLLFCESSDSLVTLSTWKKIGIYIDSCVRSWSDTGYIGTTNPYRFQNYSDPERLWASLQIIRQTIFKKHEIFIVDMWPSEVLRDSHDGKLPQVIMVGNDSSITFFDETNHTNNFNNIVRKESLLVQSPELAEEIAKLFMRVLFPYMNGSFFTYELRYEPQVYFKKNVRSELIAPGMQYEYFRFGQLQKKFKKALSKLPYDIKTTKANEYYEVDIGFVCNLPYWFDRAKIKYIKIKVFFDGTINYILPKGVAWAKHFDAIY